MSTRCSRAASLLLLLLVVVAGPSHLLADGLKTPSLRGVSLGSKHATVLRKLGKPASTRPFPKDEDLGMGELREVRFKGLVIKENRPDGEKLFTVYEIEISGGAWCLSNGVRLGLPAEDATGLLGKPEGDGPGADGQLVFQLTDRDGRVILEVKDGKVSKITILDDWS